MLSRWVHLFHDNAPVHVHSAIVTKEAVKKCGFKELAHPPYSPDWVPNDYYPFFKLKSGLRGKRFNDEDGGVEEQ